MNKKYEEWCWTFNVYKNGIKQAWTVGVYYKKGKEGDKLRVYNDLLEDYPESEGYRLMHLSDKKVI